jgi:hypothetical protein
VGTKEPNEMVQTHGGEPVVDDPSGKTDVDPEFVEENQSAP